MSNKVPFGKEGFKYFIGYKDAKKIKTLCIFLPKMIAYRENFDETKYTSFLIEDDELLEKYDENWVKVKNSLKNDYYNKPIYNEKYLKAKIKSKIEKSTQISTAIKYQKKVLNIFAYQQFCVILYLKQLKTFILNCF